MHVTTLRYQVSLVAEEDAATEEDPDGTDVDIIVDAATAATVSNSLQVVMQRQQPALIAIESDHSSQVHKTGVPRTTKREDAKFACRARACR